MGLRRHNPTCPAEAPRRRKGGIILRRSSALRLLDDTVQYRLRLRVLNCGAI
jgi:hypothetical protein